MKALCARNRTEHLR